MADEARRRPQRQWISMLFRCCNVYQRIYLDKRGASYTGWCPRCMRKAQVRVGPGGTDCRSFTAD